MKYKLRLMTLLATWLFTGYILAQSIEGVWTGALSVGSQTLRIRFDIANDKVTMYSLDQGGVGIPANMLSREPNSIQIEVPAVRGRFEGRFVSDDRIEGVWSQGMALRLVLHRSNEPLVAEQKFERPPAPGQMVDIGGRKLHLHCVGLEIRDRATPVVIMEAGGGMWSYQLRGVQEAVAKFAPMCLYDRAGLGWSDPPSAERTLLSMADDFETLMATASVRPPYILAGHSLGGLLVRRYASRFPEHVTGVVLIDASVEEFNFDPNRPRQPARSQMGDAKARLLKRTPGVPIAPSRPGTSPEATMEMLPEMLLAQLDEGEAMERTPDDLRKPGAFGTLGNTPLVVIAAGKDSDPKWRAAQEGMLRFSSNARIVVAEKSGHMVHTTEPETIVAAIRSLVVQTREEK